MARIYCQEIPLCSMEFITAGDSLLTPCICRADCINLSCVDLRWKWELSHWKNYFPPPKTGPITEEWAGSSSESWRRWTLHGNRRDCTSTRCWNIRKVSCLFLFHEHFNRNLFICLRYGTVNHHEPLQHHFLSIFSQWFCDMDALF